LSRHRLFPIETLGKTGLKVCPVGFGTGFTPEPTVIARAVDLGVNYFDTSSDYAMATANAW